MSGRKKLGKIGKRGTKKKGEGKLQRETRTLFNFFFSSQQLQFPFRGDLQAASLKKSKKRRKNVNDVSLQSILGRSFQPPPLPATDNEPPKKDPHFFLAPTIFFLRMPVAMSSLHPNLNDSIDQPAQSLVAVIRESPKHRLGKVHLARVRVHHLKDPAAPRHLHRHTNVRHGPL